MMHTALRNRKRHPGEGRGLSVVRGQAEANVNVNDPWVPAFAGMTQTSSK
jgi:hypothetical protein